MREKSTASSNSLEPFAVDVLLGTIQDFAKFNQDRRNEYKGSNLKEVVATNRQNRVCYWNHILTPDCCYIER